MARSGEVGVLPLVHFASASERATYIGGIEMVDFAGLDDYITDERLEKGQGVWIAFPNGMEFCIHRAGGSNKAFSRAFQAKMKPNRRAWEKGNLDPSVQERILRECYVEHVVIDWKNVTDKEGIPVPFTRENLNDLLVSAPELFEDIRYEADNLSNFLAKRLEDSVEDLGNS